MYSVIFLTIIASLILPLQSQRLQGFPNIYVTPPAFNLKPTFSDLGPSSYTTPYPPAYGNYYNKDYSKIRIWPYVIDQYTGYPFNGGHLNQLVEGLRPTLQTYDSPSSPNLWYNPYYQYSGKK